jgi:hypothetical protein
MTILKNFDMDALRRERARKAASGGVNLVDGINQISPDIGKLKVGETAALPIPAGSTLRKFVMSITAKLNNLTPAGGDWAGRTFKVASDGETTVYVQRGEDGEAVVRNRRGGGKGNRKAATADATTVVKGAKVTEHA